MKPDRQRSPRAPLDREKLERLALHYAGRYGTTRAKLAGYLRRKVKERGWDEAATPPPIDAIVARFAELGFVNDKAFAEARSAALQRRGYGERRIADALRASGVDEEDGAAARAQAADGAWAAALRFAERRRIGPFASEPLDRAARERAFAAMIRAGHPAATVRRLLDAAPGEIPNPDSL